MEDEVVYCASCGYVPDLITESDEAEKGICRFCKQKFTGTEKDRGYFLGYTAGTKGKIEATKRSIEEEVRVQFVYDNPLFDREKYEKYHAQWEAEIKEKRDARMRANYRSSTGGNIPKCPTCNSTNIRSIGGLERGASVLALGLFSKKINKSFKCNNCGYTW